MRAPRSRVTASSWAALALAVLAMLNVAWSPSPALQEIPDLKPAIPNVDIPDPKPLTPAQEASIKEEMTALAGVLMSGGKTPDEAKVAVNAVGICLGAAYGYDLTRAQADAVCGEVLDAYTIQPGTVAYTLTPADKAWIAGKVQTWTAELSTVLEPPQVVAVQSTMQACLEGYMKRGEDREGAVGRCLLGLLPLLNHPEMRQRLLQEAGRLPQGTGR